MPSTYLITGSSRSLGLGYARELLKAGHRVVAAVRNPDKAEQLEPVKKEFGDNLYVLKCDVTDAQSTQVSSGCDCSVPTWSLMPSCPCCRKLPRRSSNLASSRKARSSMPSSPTPVSSAEAGNLLPSCPSFPLARKFIVG